MRLNEITVGQKWANFNCHCGDRIVNHVTAGLQVTCTVCDYICFNRADPDQMWIAHLKPCRNHDWQVTQHDLEPEMDHWDSYEGKISEATISVNVYCANEDCEAISRVNIYSRDPSMDEIKNETPEEDY